MPIIILPVHVQYSKVQASVPYHIIGLRRIQHLNIVMVKMWI
jgi:hypothetical protein